MPRYKVGDRVKHSTYGNGTVIYDDKRNPPPYLVKYDKKHEHLHNGSPEWLPPNVKAKLRALKLPERCWWHTTHDLEPITPKASKKKARARR